LTINILTNLYLDGNQIIDLNLLAGLTQLTVLDLSKNQIIDLKPLAGLTNLTSLKLNKNPLAEPLPGRIAAKVCPVKPESICKF
jgi:internalin A